MSKFKVSENEVIPDGFQKCPIGLFCHSLLKIELSERLKLALGKHQNLTKRFKEGKVSNDALIAARERFCELHEAEIDIIPSGIKMGFRVEIDFANEVNTRLRKEISRLITVTKEKDSSPFFKYAKDVYSKYGQGKVFLSF